MSKYMFKKIERYVLNLLDHSPILDIGFSRAYNNSEGFRFTAVPGDSITGINSVTNMCVDEYFYAESFEDVLSNFEHMCLKLDIKYAKLPNYLDILTEENKPSHYLIIKNNQELEGTFDISVEFNEYFNEYLLEIITKKALYGKMLIGFGGKANVWEIFFRINRLNLVPFTKLYVGFNLPVENIDISSKLLNKQENVTDEERLLIELTMPEVINALQRLHE